MAVRAGLRFPAGRSPDPLRPGSPRGSTPGRDGIEADESSGCGCDAPSTDELTTPDPLGLTPIEGTVKALGPQRTRFAERFGECDVAGMVGEPEVGIVALTGSRLDLDSRCAIHATANETAGWIST
ncbi:hypothetical protein GS4_14_00600 [Gordonia soli NBRC 108243]|uniref:Uncharacterized protein n=1 Tax=Gordonia soli NBRC 108243 TaxID=1223545 RepID=M0QIE9_9ACTN|nr:hypothetical protein GS4_14_00600 [Gordonia soli NBRC 108243]